MTNGYTFYPFTETQKFRKLWLFFTVGAASVGAAIILILKLGSDAFEGNDTGFVIAFLASLIGPVLSLAFFLFMRLDTKVDNEGVHYRFAPFHRKLKLLRWDEIKEAYVRSYKPIMEYGGWGMRYGRHGRAYNVAGKTGLQLVLTNGKKILIGTQDEMNLGRVMEKVYSRGLAARSGNS